MYICSLREHNFYLYIDVLTKIISWVFCLDHVHYARWLSVHLRDMISLWRQHLEIVEQFNYGHFTIQKTNIMFSSIAIDQVREQNNVIIKGDGGAVGLTQDQEALCRWIVAGPEIARIIAEFEKSVEWKNYKPGDTRHHAQTKSQQATFSKHVNSLVDVTNSMGSPFKDVSNELLKLDTHDIISDDIVVSLKNAYNVGEEKDSTSCLSLKDLNNVLQSCQIRSRKTSSLSSATIPNRLQM